MIPQQSIWRNSVLDDALGFQQFQDEATEKVSAHTYIEPDHKFVRYPLIRMFMALGLEARIPQAAISLGCRLHPIGIS